MLPRRVTSALLPVALVGTVLLASGCTSSAESAEASATASASESATPSPSESPTTSTPSRPSAADMATDRLADAILEQLKLEWPDTLSDQLITIALSPLMRQLASTADVTTRVGSKGDRVTLTLVGSDSTCVVTVTDEPRARGVVCKAA
jgi:hypothetical protein